MQNRAPARTRIGIRAPVLLALPLLVGSSGAAPEPRGTLLADLTPEVELALEEGAVDAPLPAEPAALLDRVLRAAKAYRFQAGPLSVMTDRRWFSTLPVPGPGSPLLVVRRWPGDTVAAFYALAGPLDARTPGAPPALEGAALGPPVPGERGEVRRDGTLGTRLGDRPVVWLEHPVAGAPGRLGVLLLPGDAGLGADATSTLTEELLAVAARASVAETGAARLPWIPAGTPLGVPPLGDPPGDSDEGRDPWQIAQGADFTLGLPPGLRAKQVGSVAPPRSVPGGKLWIRGRFVDRDGKRVAVGDGRRAGYVAEIAEPDAEWRAGTLPPAGAPYAVRVSGQPYETAAEWSGASFVRAEWWREEGFEGRWLVFRLGFDRRAVEIGLPVLAGRDSLALFWIPSLWRGAGQPPAPPPIDPAQRFGIRFERLLGRDKRQRPLTEGFLAVPGLRMEIPRGFSPIASLRSKDGFPIRVIDGEGHVIARLRRLEEGTPRGRPEGGWERLKRPRAHGAESVLRRGDGAWLYESPAGFAFLLEPAGEGAPGANWERIARSVVLTRVTRPRPDR